MAKRRMTVRRKEKKVQQDPFEDGFRYLTDIESYAKNLEEKLMVKDSICTHEKNIYRKKYAADKEKRTDKPLCDENKRIPLTEMINRYRK